MRRQIILLSAMFAIVTVHGQNMETDIETVSITGKFLHTPYNNSNVNITVLTSQDLAHSPAKSIEEVLQQVPGMDIRRRGANGVQADISIQGGNFEQVLILINGIKMNDSQTGHNSMNIPVDLSNVDRIEIIKGAAARRFGNNAYSGVINIITKNTGQKNVRISAQGGDFETYQLGMASNFGNSNFSHALSANSASSEGYRHNTDYKINNIFYQNNLKIKNGHIGFQAGFSEKKFGANGFYASPTATEQYEETQASVVALKHQQNFGNLGVNSKLYWRRGQDMYVFNRQKPEIYRNMHIGNNIGGELNASYKSAAGTTGVGVELVKEFLASNNLGHRERFLTQIFAEHHFSFINNRLTMSPGISFANYSNSGSYFYPGLDAGFKVNDYHKIYGNISKVHRIPTFTDLFYVSKTEEGNPNLKPESALSYEMGYRFSKNSLLFKLSYFGRDTKDAIDWTKVNSADKWRAENIGNILTKGIETEISNSFFQNHLKASVGYTYIDNKLTQKSNFSRYALDQLKHQFNAKLQGSIANFTLEMAYRYNERINLDSFNVLDGKLGYNYQNLDVFALVTNLTNTKYTETFGVPMPGRWFHVGFSYDLKL